MTSHWRYQPSSVPEIEDFGIGEGGCLVVMNLSVFQTFTTPLNIDTMMSHNIPKLPKPTAVVGRAVKVAIKAHIMLSLAYPSFYVKKSLQVDSYYKMIIHFFNGDTR